MRTKEQKQAFMDYLLDCIDSTGYDVVTTTPAEKINFVFHCFESEFECEYAKQRTPNYQERVAYWLSGLPSCIGIDFTNFQILNRAVEFGFIPAKNATNRQESNALKMWFPGIALELMRMREKFNK